MKKILSLILSIILCLGIFVSCDNETPTETSSQSIQESEIEIEQGVSFDNAGIPIFKKGETEYTCIKVEANDNAKNKYVLFDRIIFVEYLDFLDFTNENIEGNVEINQNTFEENFVIVIYRNDFSPTQLYPCYSDLIKEDDHYVLNLEYTIHKQLQVNAMQVNPYFDFVIIPKTECTEISPKTKIYIQEWIHQYNIDVNLYR